MLVLTITRVIEETIDTRTYIFTTSNAEPLVYKAGQFITLVINRHGKELRRAYSLSTAPGYDGYNAFTVKRVTNGEISRYLFRYLVTGSTINAIEPSGRFTYEAETSIARDIYFITAGSGITPVFSLLKQILPATTEVSIKLIYQNRNEHSVIFHDPLYNLEQQYGGNFRFYNYLSSPLDANKPSRRLNNEILEHFITAEMIYGRTDALFFICGPLSFMRMAEFTIRQMGFTSAQVKKEIFEIPKLPPAPFSVDPGARQVLVDSTGKSFQVHFPQTILDAALANNIDIAYSCKAGICGSCVVKCISGEIRMKYNDVLTDEEVANGLVLTCVGYAVSDVKLAIST